MSHNRRREDWEARLEACFAQASAQKFAWGEHDCALFVCDAILAVTGLDLGVAFRGRYASALTAANLMKDEAGSGLAAMAEKVLGEAGFAEVPVLMAQRGDVVLAEAPGYVLGPTLLVVSLDGWNAVGPGIEGVVTLPLDKCARAWRVA